MDKKEFRKYKYYAQHMHMHSCYQPGASMKGHMYHANQLGMKYIWFTDHDIRMGRKKYEVDGFDFEAETLMTVDSSGLKCGFVPMEEYADGKVELISTEAFVGTQSMKMSASSKSNLWEGCGVSFYSERKRHCVSLLAGVSLQIAYKVTCTDWEKARLIFDVQLSEQPPENEPAHILYVVGNAEGLGIEPHTWVVPIEGTNMWQKKTFTLSEDVLKEEAFKNGIGGLDNAFDTIRIRVEAKEGACITAWIDDFSKQVQKNAQQTHDMQKKVAKEIGMQYGVTPFVGSEISEAGFHKNCFSSKVPLVPYEQKGYQVSHLQACNWVREHEGIFAINHPFENEKYKRTDLSILNFEEETVKFANELLKDKCWGATLMEVGFPENRCFPLSSYLKLWDILGMNGTFLTGYGSSDNHSNRVRWYSGNNFATWLGVKEKPETQITEEDFIEAMKSGKAYTGNPVHIKGEIVLETDCGATMGDVVEIETAVVQRIRFYADQMKIGWKQKWIIDGHVAKEITISSESIKEVMEIKPEQLISLVRVEIYDENGVCLLLTNPIYFYRKDLGIVEIPKERRWSV